MIIDHLLQSAHFVHSPNQDKRPPNTVIDLVVIHNISLPPGQFDTAYVEAFFTNQLIPTEHPYFEQISHLKVSSHLLIKRNGDVVQFVPFDNRAWHAGQSYFKDRESCNDFAIGIELTGTDEIAYTNKQYEILADIIINLKQHYPIEHIVGHSDIAPRRKTDPGNSFDWQKLNQLITNITK